MLIKLEFKKMLFFWKVPRENDLHDPHINFLCDIYPNSHILNFHSLNLDKKDL